MGMSSVEYAGWTEHLKRFPPGDYLLQGLVAQFMASFIKDKTALDFAPWLEQPDKREKRKEQEKQSKLVAFIQMAKEAWERKRNAG